MVLGAAAVSWSSVQDLRRWSEAPVQVEGVPAAEHLDQWIRWAPGELRCDGGPVEDAGRRYQPVALPDDRVLWVASDEAYTCAAPATGVLRPAVRTLGGTLAAQRPATRHLVLWTHAGPGNAWGLVAGALVFGMLGVFVLLWFSVVGQRVRAARVRHMTAARGDHRGVAVVQSGMFFPLALALIACDDPPPQTCQGWFTETYGFDEHPYFECSLDNRACDETPLDIEVFLSRSDGTRPPAFRADEPVDVRVRLHNPTDAPVEQVWQGCAVSGLTYLGTTTGFHSSLDCFQETTTTVGPGETETLLVERQEQGEGASGVVRVQVTMPLAGGACCPCAQAPIIAPPG